MIWQFDASSLRSFLSEWKMRIEYRIVVRNGHNAYVLDYTPRKAAAATAFWGIAEEDEALATVRKMDA